VRFAPLAALVALVVCVGIAAAAGDPAQQGEAVFQKNCSSCHTLGGGDTVGPDLNGVTERRDPDFVKRFVADPAAILAEGDPEVKAMVDEFNGLQMPDLGLSDADVDAVVAFLETQGGAATGGTTTTTGTEGGAATTPAPAAKGDAKAGEDLFTGARGFSNGGAACISCHSLAGSGALGGGRVGPDLTGSYDRYGGAAGLASVLEKIAFPTMVPVYDSHALTRREAADVAAYLQTTAGGEPSSDRTWLYVVLGVAVAVGLLLLAPLVWPRRRLVVRRRLVHPPKPRGEA
jgi:mono/diheme cytochrome c family protein